MENLRIVLSIVLIILTLLVNAFGNQSSVSVSDARFENDDSVFSLLSAQTKKELIDCGVDSIELGKLLVLSQKNFDQNFTDGAGGWRAIGGKKGCENAAGEVIKAYILYSSPSTPQNLNVLRWHAGQMKAFAGKYDEAIALFRGAHKSERKDPEWNLYVDASIAFLNHDRKALVAARDALAAKTVSEKEKADFRKFLKDNPNIKMTAEVIDQPANLPTVNNLLRCFKRSYSYAYSQCKKSQP